MTQIVPWRVGACIVLAMVFAGCGKEERIPLPLRLGEYEQVVQPHGVTAIRLTETTAHIRFSTPWVLATANDGTPSTRPEDQIWGVNASWERLDDWVVFKGDADVLGPNWYIARVVPIGLKICLDTFQERPYPKDMPDDGPLPTNILDPKTGEWVAYERTSVLTPRQ